MEGKIDKNGLLWIKRKTEYNLAYCPYVNGDCACGCFCAMFSEPVYWSESTIADISLCQKTLRFVHLIDERE